MRATANRLTVSERPTGGRFWVAAALTCLFSAASVAAAQEPSPAADVASVPSAAAEGERSGPPPGASPTEGDDPAEPPQADRDVAAPATLTAEEAVRRALARPALEAMASAEVDALLADAVEARQWSNPEVQYGREHVFGAGASAQDVLMVAQSFDVSGQRGLRAEAAERRAEATAWETEGGLRSLAAEVRLRFFELVAAQRAEEALAAWIALIEGALANISRRAEGGDASAYDRRRLERELGRAAAEREGQGAGAQRAWALLAALLGDAAAVPPRADASLLPQMIALDQAALDRIAELPEIRALDELRAAAELEVEAAERWWVPQFQLGAGWTGVDSGGGRADGYALGLLVEIRCSTWTRTTGCGPRRSCGFAPCGTCGSPIHGEVEARAAELMRLRDAAALFREDAAERSADLIRMAETAYAADELSVIELLDAYRGARDDELTALELEFAARVAALRLELLLGGTPP